MPNHSNKNKRGYRNLIKASGEPFVSDYPRPHRKALMRTILGIDAVVHKKQNQKANDALITKLGLQSLPRKDRERLAIGVGGQLHIDPDNAVTNSIDLHKNYNSMKLPYIVRVPIRLPPAYKAKLHNLDEEGFHYLKEREAYEKQCQEQKNATLKLKVDLKDLPSIARADRNESNLFENELLSKYQPQARKERKFNSNHKADYIDHDSRVARNVQYMLEIWKKAEGICDEEPAAEMNQKTDPPNNITEREDSARIRKELGKNEAEIKNIQYISKSTLEHLKKLSREQSQGKQQAEVRDIIERTLTGYDKTKGTFEKFETASIGNRESRPPKGTVLSTSSPGNYAKELGVKFSDNGDLISVSRPRLVLSHDLPFELAIPPEEIEEKQQIKQTAEGDIAQDSQNQSRVSQRVLTQSSFVKNFTNGISTQTNLYGKLEDIGEPEYTASHKKRWDFILRDIYGILKQRVLTTIFSASEKQKLSLFLDSEVSKQAQVPEIDSAHYKILLDTFLICLKQENDMVLTNLASIGIIKLDAESYLGRWDQLVFKQAKAYMLDSGSPEQQRIISIESVKAGIVNQKVINNIKCGLGDADIEKRCTAVCLLGSLDLEYAEFVIEILEKESTCTDFRARYDTVTLLRTWISKLAPAQDKPPPTRDPDALDTDDPEIEKALFHTFENRDNFAARTLTENEIAKRKLYEKSMQILLQIMTSDKVGAIRAAAAKVLGELKLGKPVFNWVLKLLNSPDPIQRMDSLKCIAFLGVMLKDNLSSYIACFKDSFSGVRIQACRVACALKSQEPAIIDALLDLQDDPDYLVRAYAIKALGQTKSISTKVKEAIAWSLQYDLHPAVRLEAVRAVEKLELVVQFKEKFLTLITLEPSEKVKRAAETSLYNVGILFPGYDTASEPKRTADGNVIIPYASALQEVSQSDIDIFLRGSLVDEREVAEVINRVKTLSTKENVTKQVNLNESKDMDDLQDLELQYDASFHPQIRGIHHQKSKDPMRGVVRDKYGVPVLI